MTMLLSKEEPFARGGNRLCFIHPEDQSLCIKVRRPDFTLADCRKKKGFPKNLRPLSAFDDNREEYRVINSLAIKKGESIFAHIVRCYGFVDTDLGAGLVTDLIRDHDNQISLSLTEYLWQRSGVIDNSCKNSLIELEKFWLCYLIPSRELLPHNIVVQQNQTGIEKMVVIDGLGSPNVIPFHWLPKNTQKNKIVKKFWRLNERITDLVKKCQQGYLKNQMGILFRRN